MKAIFLSGIDFESPTQIGDHQLARQFAANGWEVAFLSLPVTPFHLFGKNKTAVRRRIKSYRSGGYKYQIGSGSIWSYVPGALVIPKNTSGMRNPLIYDHWQKTILPGINTVLRRNGFDKVDLIYLRDPLQGFMLKEIEHDFSIFRIADNDTGFASFNENYARIEKKIAQTVDAVVYTAQSLEDRVTNLQPKAQFYLPNGVDYPFFEKADPSSPVEYEKLKKPIVVYAGSIDEWFDFDLVNRLAGEMLDLEFVIIGPNERFAHNFKTLTNLHVLGQIPHPQLPKYLLNANVGLIPFDVNKNPTLVNAISPIKLYEYMACGLPVVSTRWQELELIDSPAILCTKYVEFVEAIKNAAAPEMGGHKLKAYAQTNDWSSRYVDLIKIIGLK